MNDDLMLEYLLQMGAMRPEEEKLARKQAMVDALRQQSMTPMQGKMAGNVYVPPSFTQGLAQLGQAYGARRGQKKLDAGYATQNTAQADAIKRLRDQMAMKRGNATSMPQGGKRPLEDDDLLGYMY